MLGAMPFVIYIAVLIAALCSVIMGLDVASSPPPGKPVIAAPAEPIRHPPTLATPAPFPAAPAAAQRDNPPQTVSQSAEETPQVSPQPAPEASAGPTCNVPACTAAYISFRPEDCTYQPLSGPRRLCTK